MARASGGCKYYAPTKLGGTNGKNPNIGSQHKIWNQKRARGNDEIEVID